MKEIAIIQKSELSLVSDNSLNQQQLALLLKKTPAQFVRERPAKGGGKWQYVSGGYVKKVLNLMFGWDWDFEIMEQLVLEGEAIVKGRLTVRTNNRQIVKTQFGNKDIIYRKQSKEEVEQDKPRIALSIGNDLKAAATDCLKKCAADLGIAADIYNKDEFREIQVTGDITIEQIKELYAEKVTEMSKEAVEDAERIINNLETRSYAKLFTQLSKL